MRRFLPLVLLGALVVAACADPDRAVDAADPAPPVPTTVAADDAGSAETPSTAASAPTTSPDGDRAAAPTTAAAGRTVTTHAADPTEPAPGSGAVEPTPADDGRLGPPGAYARTMLRPRPATTLVVERFHQRGAEPADRTISLAEAALRRVVQKNVEVRGPIVLDGAGQAWTADQLRARADGASGVQAGGATAVLKILFVGGSFQGDDSVLGVAVRGDVVAVFSDSIDGARTPVLSSDAIEEAVVIHELGHVLGLVDLARDTGRADPEHPGHSRNSRSVMYWAVESSLIGQVLTGPPPRDFDQADLADLEALRNGA